MVSISMEPVNLSHDIPGVAVVTVTDGGNAVEEAVVTFSASVGTLSPNEGVIFTDAEGQATVNLTVPRASTTGTISAEVSVDNDTVVSETITYIVAFDPPTLDLELLDGSGNPTNDLTGFEQATVVVTLTNEDGPVAGEIVTLTTGAGTVLGQASGLTDENGQVTTTLTAQDISAAGTLEAATTLDLTTVSTSVNYRVNEQAPGIGSVNLQFGVDQFTIAPLTQSTARIVVTQNDADNTPVEGAVVNFSANLVDLIPASGSVFTDENGVAEVQIVAGSVPGNTQINVEVIVGEESFNPPPINLIVAEALIEVTLSDNVVEANEVIEVTAVLREATEEGRPIADTVIQLSTDIGTFATDSGLTDENGTIVLEMTGGAEAGEGTVVASASVAGNDVTGSANFQNVGAQASGDNRLELAASGMVDSFGDPDSVLAGNETAIITVTVTEDGELADGISVLFTTNQGLLSSASATTVAGVATVGLTGEGTAGVAIVDASANLSNGLQVAGSVTIATSSEQPTLRLVDAADAEIDSVELSAAESATITALVQDWNGDRIEDLGIILTATAVAQDVSSGKTVNGEVDVVLTGLQQPGAGTLVATATFGSFNLTDQIVTTSLGVNPASDNITIQEAALDGALGANTALDGNEKVNVTAVVTQEGAVREGITVLFVTTGGALDFDDQGVAQATNSGVTDATGTASVQLIGVGVAGTADITASATLDNGITVDNTVTIQTTSVQPTIDLVVRDKAGVIVDTFGANQELTLEATILDFDGADLAAGDQGQSVTFTIVNTQLGTFSPGGTTTAQDISETSACPVNGVKATPDCSVATLASSANGVVGDLRADVTVNGNAIFDIETVTNTGVNSGSPDQNSFSISREGEPITDTVAVEGDIYNNQEKKIRVDLADFFNNPVPNGTLVEFTTELGDVTPSCETVGGACEVTFTSADPRTPDNSEVSFRNTTDDGCPSAHIGDEIITTASVGGDVLGLTEYRVSNVMRVLETGGDGDVDFNADTTVLTEGVDYDIIADGIECITCTAGTELAITYRRLWLDEEDDGSTAHVLLNPGEATEPFLAATQTPCLAPARENIVEIAGNIDPDGTITVTGVGTLFRRELAVGDRIKVSGEVRTITAIDSDTSLTVDVAFSNNLNDISPERVAAPAYFGGLGQPYGGRSTIIAYAVGEESFIDTNGNEEYDFGETFFWGPARRQ